MDECMNYGLHERSYNVQIYNNL